MSEDLGKGTRGVIRALAPELKPARGSRARLRQLREVASEPSAEATWLMLAVIGRRLPTPAEVESAFRFARRSGGAALLRSISRARLRSPSRWLDPAVSVLLAPIVLDVHDSLGTGLSTGVQRMARGIAAVWSPRGAILVGWSAGRTQLRASTLERSRRGRARSVVPWRGHFVLAEVVTEPERSIRTQAIAQYSHCRSMLVGADVIPLTTAETTGPRMPGVFAKYLAAASRMSIVAAISETAALEYAGWRDTLASAGLTGPEVVAVPLAETAGLPRQEFRELAESVVLRSDDEGVLPLVLSVGSHEPRKNHGAVLQAAELLWREGLRFNLVFIGGNAWRSDEFRLRLSRLKAAGRPVQSLSGVGDDTLWWAYRLARVTVFPSVNEGFGLPIVESLHAGTPVVTSNFGSMAEIAAGGGCITVDPADDCSVADGIRMLLTDDELRETLAAEALTRPTRDWEAYAGELWRILVG
jgi:glycosyltransferase involved in cell wall biosynthesis